MYDRRRRGERKSTHTYIFCKSKIYCLRIYVFLVISKVQGGGEVSKSLRNPRGGVRGIEKTLFLVSVILYWISVQVTALLIKWFRLLIEVNNYVSLKKKMEKVSFVW